MQHLFAHFAPLLTETPALRRALLDALEPVSVAKGEIVLPFGSICAHLYFVETGFLRGVNRTEGGERTGWFWKEYDLVAALYSFLTQTPTDQQIVAVEPCRLSRLSYVHLQALYRDFPSLNLAGRLLIERYFLQAMEQTRLLQTGDVRTRYEALLALHPDIFQRTTLADIASFLGARPETISRVRRKRKEGG